MSIIITLNITKYSVIYYVYLHQKTATTSSVWTAASSCLAVTSSTSTCRPAVSCPAPTTSRMRGVVSCPALNNIAAAATQQHALYAKSGCYIGFKFQKNKKKSANRSRYITKTLYCTCCPAGNEIIIAFINYNYLCLDIKGDGLSLH